MPDCHGSVYSPVGSHGGFWNPAERFPAFGMSCER